MEKLGDLSKVKGLAERVCMSLSRFWSMYQGMDRVHVKGPGWGGGWGHGKGDDPGNSSVKL